MATWIWVLIVVVAAVVILGLVIALVAQRRRSVQLRDRFGPEYERTVDASKGRRAAENDLRNRQKQHEKLTITPLPEAARARYAEQWRDLQQRFIDQPSNAVMEADTLVRRVMSDEGYPVDDFNAQADLVSVDHPQVVAHYRTAHGIYERARVQQASTEELRHALINYRSLFDELLSSGANSGGAQAQPQSAPDGRAANGYVQPQGAAYPPPAAQTAPSAGQAYGSQPSQTQPYPQAAPPYPDASPRDQR